MMNKENVKHRKSSHRFMLEYIWRHEKGLLWIAFLRMPLEAVSGFLNIYLTATIVAAVTAESVNKLLITLFLYAGFKFAVNLINHWSEQQLADKSYHLKMDLTVDYAKTYMRADYIQIESAQGKDLAQRAKNTLFGFDYRVKPVVEAYMTHISVMFGHACGIFVYGSTILTLNPWILVLLMMTAGCTYFFSKRFGAV